MTLTATILISIGLVLCVMIAAGIIEWRGPRIARWLKDRREARTSARRRGRR